MRLGVLGGTFDPPHIGHLILAEMARDALSLERVMWVPAADPPHKQARKITSAEKRLDMVALSVSDNPGFDLSRADADRPGPHYSDDLMDVMGTQHPGAALYFLMGGDSLCDLPNWHNPALLMARCTLVVMPRPGYPYDLDALEQTLPGLAARLVVIDAPLVNLSGSAIVERVRAGHSIRYLVPPAVDDYIHTQGLYRSL